MDDITKDFELATEVPPHVLAPKPQRSSLRRWLALGAVAVLGAAAAGYWLYGRRFESTDDAQVDGNISNISPRIAGTVKAVHVVDNQTVAAGDLLAEIDPADLEVAVAQAKAAVAQAEAHLAAEDPTVSMTETRSRSAVAGDSADLASAQAVVGESRVAVDQVSAELARAAANDKTAQIERQRAERLFSDGAIA